MDSAEIELTLSRAEQALDEGKTLRGTGFWAAVSAVRGSRALAGMHADRVGRIENRAFEARVKLRIPARIGVLILLAMTMIGQAFILAALRAGVPPETGELVRIDVWPGFVPVSFLAGVALMILGSHSLAHWVVGRAVGIRFTYVFLGGPPPPRPGVKTDYESYLRTQPRLRALMHASGAVVTKAMPFLLLPPALRLYSSWPWITWLLLVIGVVQIVTDVKISTKISDWMKYRRERDAALFWN